MNRECEAPSCENIWYTSQWSKCSAECGEGVQTRRVLCGKFDGDAVRAADDTDCNVNDKPKDRKVCESNKECSGQWFSGPWSSCDKECGGGKRTRKVLCLDNSKAVPETKCSKDTIEFSSDDCNLDPCIEDEIIPIDSAAKPIEEDDEGEDYCEDDEDEEFKTYEGAAFIGPVTLNALVSTGIEMDGSDHTESILFTEELMLSDATGFESATVSGIKLITQNFDKA